MPCLACVVMLDLALCGTRYLDENVTVFDFRGIMTFACHFLPFAAGISAFARPTRSSCPYLDSAGILESEYTVI